MTYTKNQKKDGIFVYGVKTGYTNIRKNEGIFV